MCFPFRTMSGDGLTCVPCGPRAATVGRTHWWEWKVKEIEKTTLYFFRWAVDVTGDLEFCASPCGWEKTAEKWKSMSLPGSCCNLGWGGPVAKASGELPGAFWNQGLLHGYAFMPRRDPVLGLMLCCCRLKILNEFWTVVPYVFTLHWVLKIV